MKNLLKCISILLIIAGLNDSLTAQPQYYNFNNGSSSNSFPFNMSGGKDVQSLFIPGAFNQPGPAPAGTITSIFVLLSAAMVNRVYTDLTIKMGQSAITDLTSGTYYAGPMTTVYYRASVTINASGWLEFVLDTPFPYDPTQSLITDMGQCSATGSGGTVYNSMTSGIKRVWSVGGCPFVPYASGDASTLNFGITIGAPAGPTVVTTAATPITTTTATLNGTVNANGSSTTVTFDYGLTPAYGTTVPGVPSPVTGSVVTTVSAAITGLTPGTLYHFRVNGSNSNGSASGLDLTFTTAVPPPTVTTNPATNIGLTTAQLNGIVNANNFSTTVSFNWGLNTGYGNTIAGTPSPVTGNSPTGVLANISGLVTGQTYHFRCVGVNSGGTTNGLDQSFVAGCTVPPAAGAISGPTPVCANSTGNLYSVGAITNATSYSWTVPAGATITAGSGTTLITVTFGTTAGNVTVMGTNACGNGTPSSLAVTLYPSPTPIITGQASGCQGFSAVYTTQASMTGYTWTVSAGGTITSGAGTNSVHVTWNTAGPQTISVNYTNPNGCTAQVPGSYAVTVNALPLITITGTSSLCVNSGYNNYTTQSNGTNYTWTISSGGTITFGQGTNGIQVIWNQAGAQWVAVNYTNGSGCSAPAPVQYAVTVNPIPGSASTVTGSAIVCGGANGVAYSVAPIQYATDYIWTLPAGAVIASGAGTNSITVNYNANASSGNISVYGNNSCGNGSSSPLFAVTVNLLPAPAGIISGQASVCNGDRGIVYFVAPVTNATGYTWTVPPGATIAFGSNTNSIAVDYGAGAQSGNITVSGTNSCGNGTVSPDFPVTVNPIPPAPTITLGLLVLTSSAPAGNQWYFENNPIPGATGQTYTAQNTGWYWVTVTLNGCTSDPSNHIYVDVVGMDQQKSPGFTIIPVPNDGRFKVSITSPSQETFTLQVFNNLGVMIRELPGIEVKGTVEKVIDLRPVADGIYTVMIRNNGAGIVKKVVVKK